MTIFFQKSPYDQFLREISLWPFSSRNSLMTSFFEKFPYDHFLGEIPVCTCYWINTFLYVSERAEFIFDGFETWGGHPRSVRFITKWSGSVTLRFSKKMVITKFSKKMFITKFSKKMVITEFSHKIVINLTGTFKENDHNLIFQRKWSTSGCLTP